MQALEGTIPERCEKALAAGCDIALNCWARMDDQVAIANRIGAMGDAATARLERVHALMGDPMDEVEIGHLLAKRDALLAVAEHAA